MLWHNNVFYLWVDNKGNDNVVDRMTERFPTWTKHMNIIYVDTGEKLTREKIIEQMINQEPLISDEEAFLRHLMRKWIK